MFCILLYFYKRREVKHIVVLLTMVALLGKNVLFGSFTVLLCNRRHVYWLQFSPFTYMLLWLLPKFRCWPKSFMIAPKSSKGNKCFLNVAYEEESLVTVGYFTTGLYQNDCMPYFQGSHRNFLWSQGVGSLGSSGGNNVPQFISHYPQNPKTTIHMLGCYPRVVSSSGNIIFFNLLKYLYNISSSQLQLAKILHPSS